MGHVGGVGNARSRGWRGGPSPGIGPLALPVRLALLDERADTFGRIVSQHVPRNRAARRGVRLSETRFDLLVVQRLSGRAHGGGFFDDRGSEALHFGIELAGSDDAIDEPPVARR